MGIFGGMINQKRPYDESQETLLQAIGAITYRQFVAFFIFWLTIGMPIACQQHGLMTLFDTEFHAHHHEAADQSRPCTMDQHQAGSAAINVFMEIGHIPQELVLALPTAGIRVPAREDALVHQWQEQPPTPPPRFV